MNFRSVLLLFSTLLSFSATVISSFPMTAEAQADLVTNLPGLNQDIVQFSGYLDIPATEKKIHYWFVQSELDPVNDPVVFWTNGGPGCSGLLGLLTEQ